MESAIAQLKVKTQLLGENTSNVMHSIDLTLLSVLSQIQNKLVGYQAEDKMAGIIKQATVFLPQVDTIFLLNSDNQQVYSSNSDKIFDLPCFEDHKNVLRAFCVSIFIDMNAKKQIIISRRIETLQGKFKGVIAATIDPVFLYGRRENYVKLDIQGVALLDAQRHILTSWHDTTKTIDIDLKNRFNSFFSRLSRQTLEGGGLKTHETSDSIISIYQLSGFPFQIAVVQEKQSILKRWHIQKNNLIIISTLIILIGIVATFIAAAQRSKRKKAELALVDHQHQLEETIDERTLNMRRANVKLRSEIEERLQIGSKLREREQGFEQIYNSISDCLIISDIKGWILEANPASCKAYGYTRQELIGSHVGRIIHKDYHLIFEQYGKDLVATGHYFGETIAVRKDGGHINTIVKGTLYMSKGRQHVLAIIRDVTKEKHNEQQREKLISELQKALEEIKTLKGIVPICAHCKKIRDDKGYWNLIEAYIEKHSEASFSHGICPDCSDALYGKQEWYIKMKKKQASDSS